MILDKFALQMFSLRDSFAADPKVTLEKVAKLGYSGVEIAGFGSLSPKEYKEICDKNGLEIYSMHCGENDFSPSDFDRFVKSAHDARCDKIVLAWVKPPENSGEVMDICQRLNQYAAMANENRLQFFFHNHDGEMKVMENGLTALEMIAENTDGSVGFELDVGWFNFGGGDSLKFIEKYAERIGLVHIKQIKSLDERITTELQNGNVVDVKKTVDCCKTNGINRFIAEQDDSLIGEMISAKMNADFLIGG